ncbi:MAG TPA: M20/M25/M40 family metallo-hydrolase [Roseiflexaceae bacterium]|nr:M20/M25/M40 family metallo-hydrolase [Roseiflexaceae bacterium]
MIVADEQLAAWLTRLVRIPSVTPEQAGPRAGIPGEGRLAEAVAGWFRDLGGEVYVEDVLPGRPNVYGLWRGRTDRWAALDVHMDTVGVEQMPGDPFSGELRDGRLYGRGAVDTKASLAVALALLETIQRSGRAPEPSLLIAATADEESLARGAPALAAWVRGRALAFDQMAVAEPTSCCPVYGHKGLVRLTFDVAGEPAHSSQPQLGKNAITAAAHLALALDAEHRRLAEAPNTSPLGAPTLTVTLIDGGRGLNVVPDSCSLSIDRRVVSGESADEIVVALTNLAHRASPLPVTTRLILAVEAFLQAPDAPWLRQLAEWSGLPPAIAPYGTNAWAYGGLARECVVLGPGSIDQAHGVEEWVEVAELAKLAGIYARWWGIV